LGYEVVQRRARLAAPFENNQSRNALTKMKKMDMMMMMMMMMKITMRIVMMMMMIIVHHRVRGLL